MQHVAKLTVFLLVCLMTWMITSAITAQQHAKVVPSANQLATTASASPFANHVASAKAEQRASLLTRVVHTVSDAEPVAGKVEAPMPLGKSGAYAEVHLRKSVITVEDGVATVTAHVSIADRRPGRSYLWRLGVVDDAAKVLAGQVYARQIFTVDANGQKEVDFQDQVPVPPGARRVELVLYSMAKGRDLSFLDDTDSARFAEEIRTVKILSR